MHLKQYILNNKLYKIYSKESKNSKTANEATHQKESLYDKPTQNTYLVFQKEPVNRACLHAEYTFIMRHNAESDKWALIRKLF